MEWVWFFIMTCLLGFLLGRWSVTVIPPLRRSPAKAEADEMARELLREARQRSREAAGK